MFAKYDSTMLSTSFDSKSRAIASSGNIVIVVSTSSLLLLIGSIEVDDGLFSFVVDDSKQSDCINSTLLARR